MSNEQCAWVPDLCTNYKINRYVLLSVYLFKTAKSGGRVTATQTCFAACMLINLKSL